LELLKWLDHTAFAVTISENVWVYPVVLTMHTVGMAIVSGVVLMTSLRIFFGFPQQIPVLALRRLVPVAWFGFALSFISGSLLYAPEASKITPKMMFQLKILFIILGGITLRFMLGQGFRPELAGGRPISRAGRLWALATIFCWVAAIVSGRLIAYIKIKGI
jgi:hypothetical protein